MINFSEIMTMLDWNMPLEVQLKGIDLANKTEAIVPFLQPTGFQNCKNVWENCAVVLSAKSDEQLKPYLTKLLEWLKDMNWPGAYKIYERLTVMSEEIFLPAHQCCLLIAKQTQDHPWEMALNDLLRDYNENNTGK